MLSFALLKRKKIKKSAFIPVPVIIALVVGLVFGGLVGYQLSDGIFFSLGVGIALFIFSLVKPLIAGPMGKEK
jgi:hypothetical protein